MYIIYIYIYMIYMLFACVYIYIYIYTHVHIDIGRHIHTLYTNASICIYIYAYLHTYLKENKNIYLLYVCVMVKSAYILCGHPSHIGDPNILGDIRYTYPYEHWLVIFSFHGKTTHRYHIDIGLFH